LPLLTRQSGQAQVGFGRRSRAMERDQVAEVIRAACIATLAHHRVQAAGGEGRILRQGLADERQVSIDLRGSLHRPAPGQSGLRQNPAHRTAVHVQLAGDGADAPFLDVVVAQNPRFDIRGYGHLGLLCGGCGELDGAAGRCGPTPRMDGRRNGTALSPAPWDASSMPLPPRSSSSRPVEHRVSLRGNPDASHYCVARGNDGCVRRV